MDNLHAEKFTIGQNEPVFNYDGSGLSPEKPMDEVKYEGDPADVLTFEDDPETSEVNVKEELKKTVVEKEEEVEEDGTNYTNILLIGGLLLALLFYKKK
jgi:hypothetical protein